MYNKRTREPGADKAPLLLGLLLEDGRDGRPDELGALAGVDSLPDTRLAVVVDDRAGLLGGQRGMRQREEGRARGREGAGRTWW